MTRQGMRACAGLGRWPCEALADGAAPADAGGALADADAPGSGPRLGSHMPQRVSEADRTSRGRTRRLGIEQAVYPENDEAV
jgi:hypothetical protein